MIPAATTVATKTATSNLKRARRISRTRWKLMFFGPSEQTFLDIDDIVLDHDVLHARVHRLHASGRAATLDAKPLLAASRRQAARQRHRLHHGHLFLEAIGAR